MKISTQLLLLSLFFASGCSRQKTIVPPPNVAAAFESRFGNEVDVMWELSADEVYVASFVLSDQPVKSYFDENGKWNKTETEILSSELPTVLVRTVLHAYGGKSISKAQKVEELDKETIYRLSLKRGGSITEVEFTPGGVILGTPMLK
jgi:hypothetical protein